MNRGTVMEIADNTAIVLTPDGRFLRVRLTADVKVGRQISWTDDDVLTAARERAESRRRVRWTVMGTAAAALMVLVAAAWIWSFRAPVVVAYVAMDINPSVELGLDAQERVRELTAVNADAEPLVAELAFRGKPLEQVMEMLARRMADAQLLRAGGGEIVITSVSLQGVDEEWEIRVVDKVKQVLEQVAGETAPNLQAETAAVQSVSETVRHTQLTIETVFLPAEIREEAREHGISTGKMAYFLAAESSGRQVNLAQLQEQSVTHVASSIGGLKQMMEEGKLEKADKDRWKKLLDEARKTNKQLQAQHQKKQDQKDRQEDSNRRGDDENRNSQVKGKNNHKNSNNNSKNNSNNNNKHNSGKSGGKEQDKDKQDKTDQGHQRSVNGKNSGNGDHAKTDQGNQRNTNSSSKDKTNRGNQQSVSGKDGKGKENNKGNTDQRHQRNDHGKDTKRKDSQKDNTDKGGKPGASGKNGKDNSKDKGKEDSRKNGRDR